eukprot:PhF_6_TR23866/c0_g1_i1/m.33447/K11086/SNRPB, SMB; small nuclear ribonucleoprotein B and B'
MSRYTNKLVHYVGCRIQVTTEDDRCYVGKLMSFDKFANIALLDAEEDTGLHTNVGPGVQFRQIGFMLIRGQIVESISIDSFQMGKVPVDTRLPPPKPTALKSNHVLNPRTSVTATKVPTVQPPRTKRNRDD